MREDRKLRNRIVFKLTGRWPDCVVSQRLTDNYDPTNVNAVLAEVYAEAGKGWTPLTGNPAVDRRRKHNSA